ncbi:MAG: hypothetical protein AAF449_21350, partial [Myxococcota bacterium]
IDAAQRASWWRRWRDATAWPRSWMSPPAWTAFAVASALALFFLWPASPPSEPLPAPTAAIAQAEWLDVAQNLELLQNLDVLEQMDVLDDLDIIETLDDGESG